LLYIDTDYDTRVFDESYGKVIRIKPLDTIPLYVQCQVVRFWYATQLQDRVGIISDIDMYPLSQWYFSTQLLHLQKTKYVHLNPCVGSYGHIPACYHVAQGHTFAAVLGSCSFEQFMERALDFSKSSDTACGDKQYWFVDERYSTQLIQNYADQSVFEFVDRDGGQSGHRLDRSRWKYKPMMVTQGHYYDSHSIRPFAHHRDELTKLVDLLPDAQQMDVYSTHIPVLEQTLDYLNPVTVVEFGPGNYSTALFADACQNVLTIEMQSNEWYESIVNRYKGRDSVSIVKSLSPIDFVYLDYPENIDMVFVDGHGSSRPAVINFFADRAATIIAHDTEQPTYGWDKVRLPTAYHCYTCKKFSTFTTVYTKDRGLIEHLQAAGL
jgi:hypothetical protein